MSKKPCGNCPDWCPQKLPNGDCMEVFWMGIIMSMWEDSEVNQLQEIK